MDKKDQCPKCQQENKLVDMYKSILKPAESPKKIPIKRGCRAIGGCFCSGACQEIIGYRDPLFEGETY